jgi:thermostable 8-oxoguanine DNA glycosylase
MLDASNITKYNLSDQELEERILFWVLAAGKNGTTTTKLLNTLMIRVSASELGPFNAIKNLLTLELLTDIVHSVGIGCYTHKSRTIWGLAHSGLDLKTCTAEELEEIYGIGMKTSRCFIIHSRENASYAGLDTHMLKNLRLHNIEGVPKTTPTSKKLYKRLENEVLNLARDAGMTPADYDLNVWNKYSIR